jgi:DNA-binding transcriptional MerR regulator
MDSVLPSIPAKRYFTIGEVAELCGVKTHVLRYWEQEFTQLRPVKRRGNRRYYQHHEVLMIRRIRDLLYEQGFTISGARNKLQELVQAGRQTARDSGDVVSDDMVIDPARNDAMDAMPLNVMGGLSVPSGDLRQELLEIRSMLTFDAILKV